MIKKLLLMRKLISLLLIFECMCCFSQKVISTQGGSNSNSAGSLDYSIGEVVVTFGSNDTTHLTQGFQQPFFEITNIETFEISFDVLIYPNPAVDQLTIEFQEILNGSRFDLYDANGKLLQTKLISDLSMIIPFSKYETGVYLLSFISSNNKLLKTYKIQKSY